MPEPRQISGPLRNLSGEPYADHRVVIELVSGFYTPDAQYIRSVLDVRTDVSGNLTALLVPNVGDTASSYRLTVGGETWAFTLPEGTLPLSWSEVRTLGVTSQDPQYPTLAAYVDSQIAAAGGIGGGTGGTGINILGSVADPANLPTTGNAGDAYLISPDLWVWSPNTNEYLNAGPVQGPPGAEGPAGTAGVAGVPGPAGVTGIDGPAGATGVTGLQGIAGATGPAGADGVAGPTGPVGPAAVAGATGPVGPQGTGLTILGSYATPAELPPSGAAGDAYLVQGDLYVWSATSNSYENVGRIQGPIGDTGPAGAQGVQGLAGTDGATGSAGVAGPQGIQGDTGLTGPAGVDGAAGPQGLQGAKGDTGAIGPAGPTGAQGTTGATGTAGATGPQGLQGIKGDAGGTGPAGAVGPTGATGATGPQGPAGPQVERFNFAATGPQLIIFTTARTLSAPTVGSDVAATPTVTYSYRATPTGAFTPISAFPHSVVVGSALLVNCTNMSTAALVAVSIPAN